MIERIEIEVREYLARQVADGQSLRSPNGCEKVVSGEIITHKHLFIASINDSVDQPQCFAVSYQPAEQGFQYLVVDGWEVLSDVAFQHVLIFSHELLILPDCPMRTFPDAVGITVMDQTSLYQGADDVYQGMVNDTVSKWSSTDRPGLGMVYLEGIVSAGLIHLLRQLVPQLEHILCKSRKVAHDVRLLILALGCLV